jgi:predicted DNA-binding transcriptional regulator YafY
MVSWRDALMSNKASRLLSLILLLQSKSNWKAADLAAELEVSERTIHRYLAALGEMGIPICSERGLYGGFSLMRGYRLPPLVFSAEEATVLYMGANLIQEVWGQTHDEVVRSVTAKLDNVLPDDLRAEVARARQSLVVGGLTRIDYRPWGETLRVLRRSIMDRQPVELSYQSFIQQEPTDRVIDPYALAFRWGLWYLVAFCHLRQALRIFRVDRIRAIRPLPGSFAVPADFSVRDYLAETMRLEPTFRVVIDLDATVAPLVRERHGHWMTISDHEDGSITVTFDAAELDWATGWTLQQGPGARAIAPPELVKRVRNAARAIWQQYEKDNEPATQSAAQPGEPPGDSAR